MSINDQIHFFQAVEPNDVQLNICLYIKVLISNNSVAIILFSTDQSPERNF